MNDAPVDADLSTVEQSLKTLLLNSGGAMLQSQVASRLGGVWRRLNKPYAKLKKLLAEFPSLLTVVYSGPVDWVVLTRPFLLPIVRRAVRSMAPDTAHQITHLNDVKADKIHKTCPLTVLAKGASYGSVEALLRDAGMTALKEKEKEKEKEQQATTPQPQNEGSATTSSASSAQGNPGGQKADLMSRIKRALWDVTMDHLDGVPLAELPTYLPSEWTQLGIKLEDLPARFADIVQTYSRPNKGLWVVMVEPRLLQTVQTEMKGLFATGRASYSVDKLCKDFKRRAQLQYLTACARCGDIKQFLTKLGFYVDSSMLVHLEKPVAAPPPTTAIPELPSIVSTVTAPAPAPAPASTGPMIVNDVQSCLEVVRSLETDQPIAIDLEGTLWGKIDINLIQIASKSGRCYLFDLVESDPHKLLNEGGLKRLLEDVRVLKVGHDLRTDATALWNQFSVLLNHAFDTQVGHASLGSSKQASLNEVLQHYGAVENTLKPLMKLVHEENRSFWRQRPLTREMINYAADDVRFLLRAFDRMAEQLEKKELYESALAYSRSRIDQARFGKPKKEPLGPTVDTAETKRTVCSDCRVDQDVEDMGVIIDALPSHISEALMESENLDINELVEIIIDLGRRPRARFAVAEGSMPFVELSEEEVTKEDLKHFCKASTKFDHENRAGISRTLHRISRLQNREGKVVGLTIRVGKTIRGLVKMIRDVLKEAAAQKSSILLLGAPGMGKTSVIREMARVLANEEEKSVMIVDTSNEIAGDGDVPHPAIGSARRMQVPEAAMQHKRMIEAVQNHTPDVIIVDEIGTRDEAAACCTIARRGVMLIATAHGVTLKDVVDNPSLNSVLGGIETVILGDKAMEERQLKQKTVREAKGPSAFQIAIELRSRTEWIVHRNVRENVNLILEDKPFAVEERRRFDDGKVEATRKFISCSEETSDDQCEGLLPTR